MHNTHRGEAPVYINLIDLKTLPEDIAKLIQHLTGFGRR